MKCPKCGYVRLGTDLAPDWQCPSCQVAYAKARVQAGGSVAAGSAPDSPRAPDLPRASKSAPRSAGAEDPDQPAALAASGQKIVIHSILLTFVVRGLVQGNLVAPLAGMVMNFGVAAYSLVGVLRICSALRKSQNQKLMYMALSCMPWLNLVALVVLNARATGLLRAAGWRVGLLGARS